MKRHYDQEEKLLGQYIGHELTDLQNWHQEIEQHLRNISLLAIQEGLDFEQNSYIPGVDLMHLFLEAGDMIKENNSREHVLFLQMQLDYNNSNLIYA